MQHWNIIVLDLDLQRHIGNPAVVYSDVCVDMLGLTYFITSEDITSEDIFSEYCNILKPKQEGEYLIL